MATVNKDFKIKNGLVVEGSTATVNGHDVLTESLVDAKGDLLVASGADAVTRLAVGTNNYILTADSNEATGIKWAAPQAVGEFGSSIVFEGSTSDGYETTLEVTDPTADRTITLPNATGTVTLNDATQTLSNKTISYTNNTLTVQVANINDLTASATELNYVDGVTSAIQTQIDTKASSTDLSNHTGATEAHGATGAVVGTTNTQTLTNKTLTSPVIATISNTGTLTLPTSTDTLVGRATTDTLTNKTLTSPVVSGLTLSDGSIVLEGTTANDHETTITVTDPTADRTITLPDATGTVALTNNKLDAFAATSSAELASVISDETGTGALVFANTPTLVTPNIGVATGTSLTLSGDLIVNGTTTTINSTEITVDDKNLVLGSVASPTDAGADGGGLTLKGATDKTFNWVDATDSWTSSEHIDLASGKVLKVNGTQVLSATEYTGNAATVTNGVYTTSKISALASTSSSELAGVISDETGTGALVFANTPTLVTPELGAATGTSIAFPDALAGSATATAGTSATTIDTWSATTYSAAKYIVQMKKGNDIEVIEMLVAVNGDNNVYITEYANVVSNDELGTTNAVYSSGNVLLQVTGAAADTVVKVHKTYIEA